MFLLYFSHKNSKLVQNNTKKYNTDVVKLVCVANFIYIEVSKTENLELIFYGRNYVYTITGLP